MLGFSNLLASATIVPPRQLTNAEYIFWHFVSGSWLVLGRILVDLHRSWRALGRSWTALGRFLGALGRLLGALGRLLGTNLGVYIGPEGRL